MSLVPFARQIATSLNASLRSLIEGTIELKDYGHDRQLEQRVSDVLDAEVMDDQFMGMSLLRGSLKAFLR